MQDVRFKVYERKLRCIFPPIFNVHCTLKYKQQEHLVCLHISPHCICHPWSRFPTHGRHGSSLTSSLLPSLLWLMKGLYVWDDAIRGLTAEMHLQLILFGQTFIRPIIKRTRKSGSNVSLKVWLIHSFGSRPRLLFWCPNICWEGRGPPGGEVVGTKFFVFFVALFLLFWKWPPIFQKYILFGRQGFPYRQAATEPLLDVQM